MEIGYAKTKKYLESEEILVSDTEFEELKKSTIQV